MACAQAATGYTCARQEPEKTALYQLLLGILTVTAAGVQGAMYQMLAHGISTRLLNPCPTDTALEIVRVKLKETQRKGRRRVRWQCGVVDGLPVIGHL